MFLIILYINVEILKIKNIIIKLDYQKFSKYDKRICITNLNVAKSTQIANSADYF